MSNNLQRCFFFLPSVGFLEFLLFKFLYLKKKKTCPCISISINTSHSSLFTKVQQYLFRHTVCSCWKRGFTCTETVTVSDGQTFCFTALHLLSVTFFSLCCTDLSWKIVVQSHSDYFYNTYFKVETKIFCVCFAFSGTRQKQNKVIVLVVRSIWSVWFLWVDVGVCFVVCFIFLSGLTLMTNPCFSHSFAF